MGLLHFYIKTKLQYIHELDNTKTDPILGFLVFTLKQQDVLGDYRKRKWHSFIFLPDETEIFMDYESLCF